jgi:hypothetical protein
LHFLMEPFAQRGAVIGDLALEDGIQESNATP